MPNQTTDAELIKRLTERIAANPGLVPKVLTSVSAGLAAWEEAVQGRLDYEAEVAIKAALGLPRWGEWGDGHEDEARLVVTGLGLDRRKPSSRLERSLVELSGDGSTDLNSSNSDTATEATDAG